ncbi:MAG: hypothetical protein KC503_26810 [Myxococcales bacterium]|nr:hypothetical protein [Myxococcales bacterium]
MLRRVALFVVMVALGCVPALLVLTRDQSVPDIAPRLVGRAKAVAIAIDARGALWRAACERLAVEVGGLLAQLDKRSPQLGNAAEGTLMLHLGRRLREAPDFAELAVLDAEGKLLISTDGTRSKGKPPAGFPELASIAQRSATLLADGKGRGQLVTAAPIRWPRGDRQARALRGVLVGLLRLGAKQLIPGGAPAGSATALVDADGRRLDGPRASESLAALAARSSPGAVRRGGRVIAHAPLSRTRAAVIVSATPPAPPSPYRSWHLALLAGVLVVSGLGAWAFGRSSAKR